MELRLFCIKPSTWSVAIIIIAKQKSFQAKGC